ncbi:thioesterase family protein [Halocatena marina]|uniref:Thioesterase family protein n=1 Tax=Halocatena marina TaxID=2934937 RepID=A0ABD5YV68_9EURY
MNDTLQAGIKHELRFGIPESKTVPSLYPESQEFQAMPDVFATGFFIGLVEWACIQAVNPHLDWPQEQTVGTHVDVSHEAATPPGLEAVVHVELTEIDGRRLLFDIEASDGVDLIGQGSHERFVINAKSFSQQAAQKGKQQ